MPATDRNEEALDLNSPGFRQSALAMEPDELLRTVLKSDDLRCSNEDQVVDLIKEYISKNGN